MKKILGKGRSLKKEGRKKSLKDIRSIPSNLDKKPLPRIAVRDQNRDCGNKLTDL